MFAWVPSGSSVRNEPVGLHLQMAAPGPYGQSLVPLQAAALRLDSVHVGGIRAAAGLWQHHPLSHDGLGSSHVVVFEVKQVPLHYGL